VQSAQQVNLEAEVFLSLDAEIVMITTYIGLKVVVDTGATVVGVFCLTGAKSAFWLRDSVKVLELAGEAAALEVLKF
jgi:hypothetical protein